MVGNNWTSTCKKNLDTVIISFINIRKDCRLKCKMQNYKTPKYSMGKYLDNFGYDNNFLFIYF